VITSPTENGAGRRSRGRPRRFTPTTEIQLIVDATHKLLRQNDYEDVSIAAILAESGLSTRSFYRHFGSKDELLIAMYRQNAEQTGRQLAARVAAAASPREGLEAWVAGMLRLRFDPRVARRVAIFGAPSARRAAGYEGVQRDATEVLRRPLLEVLEAGRTDGSFPLTDPAFDSRAIQAVVLDLTLSEVPAFTRDEARHHVLRFVLPGLGGEWPRGARRKSPKPRLTP
jgi:AcrR family transcriptional regulator